MRKEETKKRKGKKMKISAKESEIQRGGFKIEIQDTRLSKMRRVRRKIFSRKS